MTQKQDRLLTISMMPWRNGLLTAGHQTSIEETALWDATNFSSEIDGMLVKRPGRKQYGQTIMEPDASATGSTKTVFVSWLNGWAGFATVDTSAGDVSHTFNQGVLQTAVDTSNSTNKYVAGFSGASSSSKWSFRFQFRGSNLQPYTAASTVANTFSFRVGASGTSGKEFAIWYGGLYYKKTDNSYALLADANLGLGNWHSIEVRCDDSGGSTTAYIDDDLEGTVTSATIKDVSLTAGNIFEFQWQVEGSGTAGKQYSTYVSSPMYNDVSADAFIGQSIVALTDFRYTSNSNSPIWALVCAAGNYIYHDNMLEGCWRPLHPKQRAKVFFNQYRNTMMWSDHNNISISSLWQWDGRNTPILMDDAPFIKFFTEHQQRVWGVGNGIQLYYSADRQPNQWFSPSPDNIEDQFEVVLDAGYLPIPSGRGNEYKALFGDYYGNLIAGTRRGMFRVVGFGPNSYSITNIDQQLGVESPYAMAKVGNDVLFAGRDGVGSVITTDQYGDLKAAQVSIEIADLWLQHPSNENTISLEYANTTLLAYNPPTGLIYLAVPSVGQTSADRIYTRNTLTQRWLGPEEGDYTAMANVELTGPIREVIMFGSSDGKTSTPDVFYKYDFGTVYTSSLETALLTGRSVDPSFQNKIKTWRWLYIYILPRYTQTFTVEWWVDTNPKHTKTLQQNQAEVYVLDEDFRLDLDPDAIIRSAEEMTVIKVSLDERGTCLGVRLLTDYDMGIQGMDVLFKVDGHETENNSNAG